MANSSDWIQRRPLRIVLPGGSGQVGRMLAGFFQERGHHVTVLTRSPYTAPWATVHWDGLHPGPWVETLEGADVCIHLSGRSINCRYTARNLRALHDSRVGPTRLLHQAFDMLTNPPWLWMNASSATIYRHALDRDMDEVTGEVGGNEWVDGWLGSMIGGKGRAPEKWQQMVRLVRDWERAFFSTPTPLTRKIALRTSLVFSPVQGNVFALLSRLARVGLGGTQGNGRQFVSWMHEADYARAIEFLIEHEELDGAVNMSAPHPLPNREFNEVLRDAWGMPNGLPAPAPLLELGMFLLRKEPELVLKSRRVVPKKLLDAGFQFQFPTWPEAAEDLVRQWREAARDS